MLWAYSPPTLFDSVSVTLALLLAAGLLLDAWFGEVRRFHPLIGFGHWANWIEKQLNRSASSQAVLASEKRCSRMANTRSRGILLGVCAWCLAILPILLGSYWLFDWLYHVSLYLWLAANVIVLYFTVGKTSLLQHAQWIYRPLVAGDLCAAREKVGWIVSRDTSAMDQYQVTSATVESVLENGNDAVFGAMFWFIIGGAPAAVLFRLVNTLDAMWGYKNDRYCNFGYSAAKLDDAMGWLPARLTGLTYALVGNTKNALHCWRTQAHLCASPNGGVVMTSGAGAINTTIGGPAIYHGIQHDKIFMGQGEKATAAAIALACGLVERSAWLWVAVLVIIAAL
ncbi:adenosylcobinamide-phosphate synthase CbiB [Photobacterium sanguinicancri]|uniref:adenosylcobinamide-phosphate synthase CbiB n=1 Tax=Photobacterium sanguinicancri TaxID=875932 RepID=UPI00247FCD73|nr:adenosylcobinamide-phosphate synthase CbiB [Photobacterium sanguinicancri]